MSTRDIVTTVRGLAGPSIEGPDAAILLAFDEPGTLTAAAGPGWVARWQAVCSLLELPADEDAAAPVDGMDLVAATAERLLAAAQGRRAARPRPAASQIVRAYLLFDAPEPLARRATALAMTLAGACSTPGTPAEIAQRLAGGMAQLREAAEAEPTIANLDPVSRVVAAAAAAGGIACRPSHLYPGTMVLGEGARQVRFDHSLPLTAPSMGSKLSSDKLLTKRFLAGLGMPVLPCRIATTADAAVLAAERVGFPVVIKPTDGSLSRGVMLAVADAAEVPAAFAKAMEAGNLAMIEPYLDTPDFRATVIGGRIAIVMRRNRPYVVGDGTHAIAWLIERHNADLAAGRANFPAGYPLTVDGEMLWTLGRAGRSLETVPARGERVEVRTTPMRSRGGYPVEVTAETHPDNIQLFERIATVLDMPITALDFRAEAVERPWREQKFAILEANARPSITDIEADRLAAQILRAVFPEPAASRLPTVLVLAAGDAAAAALAQVPGLGYAGPEGIFLGGIRIGGEPPSLAAAHDRIVEDPTARVALHWTGAERIAERGLGLARIDHAFLPADAAGAVPDLVRRHADRVEVLPAEDGTTAPVLAAITRLDRR